MTFFLRRYSAATIAFAALLNSACAGYDGSPLDSTDLGGFWLTYQLILEGRTIENLSSRDLIQPANWSIVQNHLLLQAAAGRSGSPSSSLTTMTGLPTTNQGWFGGVLTSDGKIYGCPNLATTMSILIVDTNTLDETTLTFTGTANVAYYGGALAPDGTIHMVPRQETDALIVDPLNKTVDKTSITGLPGGFLYQAAAVSPDGLIYHNGIGGGATAMPIIDPVAKTFTSPNLINAVGTNQFFDIIAAPNGKLYCIPLNADYVTIIETKANGRINTNLLTSGYFNHL